MYAEVVLEYPVKKLDKTFTYKVPLEMKEKLHTGMQVLVPLKTSVVNGIVLKITNSMPEYETKEILKIKNEEIYLNDELLALGLYLKKQTLCTLITAYQTMMPPSLKIKNQKHKYALYDTYIVLNKSLNEIDKFALENPKSKKQIAILNLLEEKKQILKKEIASSSLNELLKKGYVKENVKQRYRLNEQVKNGNEHILNSEQKQAYDEVVASLGKNNTFLLHGVTGSGKTEVYMQIIKQVIKNGKTAIVLVPEISLTTQTVARFYARFGSDVAIFHSGLSDGEKYDEYLKIYREEVHIVVGTRSSIFVPLKNIGIIIIDEEHSDTYKQDSNPRYSTLEMAKKRCEYHKAPLILSSATPLLETKARADKGVYKLLTLNKRANNMPLPECQIVDMTLEVKKRNFIYSDLLKTEIANRLNKKEQIILLLNRRGFSTFISCASCGFVYKCPNCDITLTYHKTTNNLRCHYCGYVIKKDDCCPKCHEKSLNYLGLGTQKAEEELQKLFPLAKIIRMDQDTTSKKGSYQKIIDDFEEEKYDILLGTQMISKGLDFKNVTLVGIINADTSLNVPDFRANEKTFALLYQTSGRCGRDEKKGKVIIQTFNPDNAVLNYVKNNDYQKFYLYEMNIRHQLLYPPYTYIALIIIKSTDYNLAFTKAEKLKQILQKNLAKKTIIYGPTPAGMFKINNVYHLQITIKYTYDDALNKTLEMIDKMFLLENNLSVEITFDPTKF